MSESDEIHNNQDEADTSVDASFVREVFDQSLDCFLQVESNELMDDINERSSCGRLAIYLEHVAKNHHLIGYFADVEYNRKQNGEIKTIIDDASKVIQINCDLILHSRGQNKSADNLIAVEMKKSSGSPIEKQKDRDRLRALTKASYDGIWSNDGVTQPKHVCGYILGVFIEINSTTRSCLIEYYAFGNKFEQLTRTF